MRNLALCVLLALVFTACSTAYYHTTQDGSLKINKAQPVRVLLPENSDIEDRSFARLLAQKLSQHGFKLQDDAKCAFVFNMDEPTYQSTGSYTTYNTSTSYTNVSGFVGGTYVYGSASTTTTTPQTNYYTYAATFKKIYVDFACLNANGELESVWEGFASALLNDFMNYNEQMVDNLVVLVGENFTGNLRISGDQNVKSVLAAQKKQNYLFLEADFGFGFFSEVPSETISLSQYGYYDDIVGAEGDAGFPINLRVGLMHKFSARSSAILNLVYTKNFMANSLAFVETKSGRYESGKSSYSTTNVASLSTQQLGAELMYMYSGYFVGLGVSKDIGSNITYPVGSSEIKRDIDGLYLPIRLGCAWALSGSNFGVSFDLGTSVKLSGDSYSHNQFSINMGIIYLLPLW